MHIKGSRLINKKVIAAGQGKVRSTDVVRPASEISSEISNIATDGDYLSKTKVVTEDGVELGQVSDILFDSQTGDVVEFEISQGAVENIKSGRKTIPTRHVITIGQDAMIVDDAAEVVIDTQKKQRGATGQVNKAAQTIGDISESAQHSAQEKLHEIQQDEKTQEVKQQAQSTMNELSHQIKNVTGEMKRQFKQFTKHPKIQEAIQNTKQVTKDAKKSLKEESPFEGKREEIKTDIETENSMSSRKRTNKKS